MQSSLSGAGFCFCLQVEEQEAYLLGPLVELDSGLYQVQPVTFI